ncbi:MAG: hypothetical protein R3B09_23365 [Nannocystaceae bacterium]
MAAHRTPTSPLLFSLFLAVAAPGCDAASKPQAQPRAEEVKTPTPPPVVPPPQEIPAPAAEEKAPTPPAAPEPALGRISAAFLAGAVELSGLDHLEIEVRADGTIEELEAYHQDASKIPAPVLAALEATYPGAKILAYETELEGTDPAPVYEIEVKTKDKKKCELEAKADGAVIYTECAQAAKSVPAEIQAVLDKRLPGGKITEVEVTERVTGDRTTEVKVSHKGETHVLEFEGADGTMRRHSREVAAVVAIEIP